MPDLSSAKNDMWNLKRSKMQTRVIFSTRRYAEQTHCFGLMFTIMTQKETSFAHDAMITCIVRG